MARSDEIIAADSGMVHSVHCRTRGDVVIYIASTQGKTDDGNRPAGYIYGLRGIRAAIIDWKRARADSERCPRVDFVI